MSLPAHAVPPLDPEAVMLSACRDAGLDASGARLLHHYSNAIFHLPAEDAVARVTSGAGAHDRVRLTHDLTRWLVDDCRFPATRPLPGVDIIDVADGTVVSFWIFYQQPEQPVPLTSAHLAALLRELHRLESPPLALPTWEPLVSLHDTLHDPNLSRCLPEHERGWLVERVAAVREQLRGLDWPLGVGLIHGDAWAGNLLHADVDPAPVILGDWDWASNGPREVDLIPTWHAAARYGKGANWVDKFRAVYGYDLADWDGFPTLMAMRDLVQLTGPMRRASDSTRHAAALRQRLDALLAGDTVSPWIAL
ncbi:hypothetical protein [Catellatospora sp. NPDC049609]|uniref:hypothetical protein n=1 Tax=Catellatospora sp. NPDC049609 TaxID=3155505 RepID=UPI00342F262D